MKKKKWILLAEDNSNDADLALRVLSGSSSGIEVIVAEDGQEVMDLLHQGDEVGRHERGAPSLLLLDLKMPRVTGMEVLRLIKSDPRLRRIPVVLFTSSKEEADLSGAYELSANAYVVKPLNFQDFAATLTRVFNFWMLANELPSELTPGDARTLLAQAI